MYETESERRREEKAWRQRNSDGKATNQGPPGFTLTEAVLEDSDLTVEYPTDVTAILHEHVYAMTKPDWLADDGPGI
jgi:hypothetical protein